MTSFSFRQTTSDIINSEAENINEAMKLLQFIDKQEIESMDPMLEKSGHHVAIETDFMVTVKLLPSQTVGFGLSEKDYSSYK